MYLTNYILLSHLASAKPHLLSCLGFSITFQKVALYCSPNNGQPLPGLQLWSKCQEPGVFHMQILIQFQQYQQLGSKKGEKEENFEWQRSRPPTTNWNKLSHFKAGLASFSSLLAVPKRLLAISVFCPRLILARCNLFHAESLVTAKSNAKRDLVWGLFVFCLFVLRTPRHHERYLCCKYSVIPAIPFPYLCS